MAIGDPFDGVGNRLVKIVAFDEDGVEAGDRADVVLTGAFEISGSIANTLGGKPLGGRWFAGGEARSGAAPGTSA